MERLGPATEEDMVNALTEAEGADAVDRRSYSSRTSLFQGWPPDVKWIRASLSLAELKAVSLIRNERSWVERAGPARSPSEAADWVRRSPLDETAVRIEEYHRRLHEGEMPPPIVLVGPENATPSQLVVLEGNRRTVALCMSGVPIESVAFLVGTSAGIRSWLWYADGNQGGPH